RRRCTRRSRSARLRRAAAGPCRRTRSSAAAAASVIAGEIVERRRDAALLERHLVDRQTHLDARQRAGKHQVVEVAEMADAEHLALHLAEALAERHVEALQDGLAQMVG